jgi:maltose alpha-D-glucosyltransferase / alpha-amylase
VQPLWFRNAVIYQVDPAVFRDSDGDGWGDLAGVTERLEYIRGLGANCLWLLPFYPTPYRDGGYDLTDHLAVDRRFGDVADVALLLDKADDLGLRVIVDLVAQHTSVEHRWFQEARRSRDSPYRDFYIWTDDPDHDEIEPIFPTVEESVWTWDEEAQQHYRHMFYSHEPDLELGNPRVREQLFRTMAFWLRLGVAGFRIDAAPYMVERARVADPTDGGYWLLQQMRELIAMRRPDGVLLGEMDVPVSDYPGYFGGGDRTTMLLDFWSNNHTFHSLARENASPLRAALRERPDAPRRGQYATFLRNHDELDLERLDEDARQEVLDTFAPKDEMRAYGRGIRRRLAPMLDGDDTRIAMAHALLMSLPGAPVLLYGDEIGMGEELSRPERFSVRTPMQWSDAENGGFSEADAHQLVAPLVQNEDFGPTMRNVYAMSQGEETLLSKVGNLARTRSGSREIGGTCRVLDASGEAVLALLHEVDDRQMVTAVNLSPEEVRVEISGIDLADYVGILSDAPYPAPGEDPEALALNAYGYRWLRRREDLFH